MTREQLIRIYSNRVGRYNIQTSYDLVELLERDEKAFMFFLMDSYLCDRDLTHLFENITVGVYCAIELFCIKAGRRKRKELVQYFRQFINVDEIGGQMDKIIRELDLI